MEHRDDHLRISRPMQEIVRLTLDNHGVADRAPLNEMLLQRRHLRSSSESTRARQGRGRRDGEDACLDLIPEPALVSPIKEFTTFTKLLHARSSPHHGLAGNDMEEQDGVTVEVIIEGATDSDSGTRER